MGLRSKVNLAFVVIFGIGLLITTGLSFAAEFQQAREQVLHDAEVLLSIALSTRSYTVQQVRPLLSEQNEVSFLPQTVPSYAAQETFLIFKEEFPEFSYREVALNPTNPRDLANSWEVDVIQNFISDSNLDRLTGERQTGSGDVFYLARPIRINDEACLACHSTPDVAPQSMIEIYGASDGFGWKKDEVVGAQIITVPTDLATSTATESTTNFVISLVSVFILVLIALNILLGRMFIQPLKSLAGAAESYSKGDFSPTEFAGTREDEIGKLEKAMNRLRRSLDKLLRVAEHRE